MKPVYLLYLNNLENWNADQDQQPIRKALDELANQRPLSKEPMKPENINQFLKEYVESGKYFSDAMKWYNHKYLHPFSQRSFVFIISAIVCTIFLGVILNIKNLFPIVTQVKYYTKADTITDKTAQIIRADRIDNKPLASIVDILLRNYIIQRERYNYDLLKSQFLYIKNSSTRIVFKHFYDYMNIDNPSSPVLIYQKDIKRSAEIISSEFITDTKAKVKFNSIAKNIGGEIVEDMIWLAEIEYEVDSININMLSESRFNFTVTDYQLKLLEDKRKK